ncbi:MAG: hypothetical protein WA435_12140 [Gallionellaceae bacterium]
MSKVIFMMLLAVASNSSMAVELVCSGTVHYGNYSFEDELALRFSGTEVEVSGEAGQTSTFESGLPYKICSESKNEVEFEYSTKSECGKESTRLARYGYLQKILGKLKLKRMLLDKPFYGDYNCKPAARVLN